jgi:hypothetical protein
VITISGGVRWRPSSPAAGVVLDELAAAARPVPGIASWPPDGATTTDLVAAPPDAMASVADDCADALDHVLAKGPAHFADPDEFLDVVLDLSWLQWLLRNDPRIDRHGLESATAAFLLTNAASMLRERIPTLAVRVLEARRSAAGTARLRELDESQRQTVAAAVRAAAARAAASCAGEPRASAIPTAAVELMDVLLGGSPAGR